MHSAERKEDKQMPKLLIIDGSSMLSTSYYGNLPKSILFAKTEEEKEKHYGQILHTSDGKYTNAMFTMLRTLLGIYKKVKPEYVAFVFDKTRDTFRRTELGADFYKANRKETAKPLKEQFIQMEEFLQEIGCAVFMSDDYEADDYAASLVEKFEGPDLQTYVLTKDHDYFQVVSEYTRMWRVVNKDKLEQLKETYGLFGNDVYESLPANVFEYLRKSYMQKKVCIRSRSRYFWQSPEILETGYRDAKVFLPRRPLWWMSINPWMRSMQPSMTVRELQKRKKS